MLNKIVNFFHGKGYGKNKIIRMLYIGLKKFYFPFLRDKLVNINYNGSRFKIIVNPKRGAFEEVIYYRGHLEREICKLLQKELKKGDTFVDVGANIGFISLIGRTVVGDEGKVICYEPITPTFKLLERNIKANSYSNIILKKLGIGSKNSNLKIFYDLKHLQLSSIYNSEIKSKDFEMIRIVKLDDSLKNQRIDFVKIDIEGGELEAFKGMENILKTQKPKLIFEFAPLYYKKYFKDWKKPLLDHFTFLDKFGYNFYAISLYEKDSLTKISNFKEFVDNINFDQVDIFAK